MNGEAPFRRAIGTAAIVLAIVAYACGDSKSPTAPSTSPAAVSTPTTPASVAPSLVSISPGAIVAGASGTITFTGTGFVAGSTISVGGSGVVVQDVTLVNSTSITARVTIDPSADIGARPVRVTTNGGTTSEQPLTINAMTPSVTSMTMSGAATPGATVDVALRGTGFVPGATTVSISGSGVSVVSVNATAAVDQITTQDMQSGPMVASNLTTLTVRLAIDRNAAPGPRTLTVTTPGGTSTFTFTVATPLPTIGSFGASPVIIQRGRSATLSWSDVTNATRCEINIGIGVVPCANGRVDVTPDVTTEYMFSASGPGGREWTYTTVVVEGAGPPAFESLTIGFAGSIVQTIAVPAGATRATITAIGAGGGGSSSLVCLNPGSAGGAGARITGTFTIQPNSQLRVIVGGGGDAGAGDGRGAGGGGGSFVFTGSGTLQIAAGGGGGAGSANGINATFSETGGSNSGGDPGGALGAGGASSGLLAGGSGGGVVSAGGDATGAGAAQGGGLTSSTAGGAGGVGLTLGGTRADGGFGGGGGGGGSAGGGGGGGGGYSGGRAATGSGGAGGGGSFNAGGNPAATVGAPGGSAGGPGGAFCVSPTRGGNGSVIIVWQ